LKTYYNLDEIHGNNYNKIWVTDSKTNRIVSKKIAEELVENGNWFYGKSEKHIEVNDGTQNSFIPKSEFDDSKHELGWIKKYITNGSKDKLMTIHIIDDFIKTNPEWKIGYSKNEKDIWITNGIEDKKIKYHDLKDYEDFYPGRTFIGVKNKISIFKDDEFKWILESEFDDFERNGWGRKGRNSGYNLFMVTDNVSQKHFRCEKEKNEFLEKNKNWRDGQLHRESFNTNDIVFAKDMVTDEKVTVTKEEYKSNKYLTSIKTKKVKIKKSNKIIFTGYLDLFLIENSQYPKTQFMNALRSESGDLVILKGKNKWLTDEKISIKLL
jgi:hypothetical protein